MKVSYIIALLLLAVITGMFISTLSAPSEYADFGEVFANPGKEFTVVGQLNKTKGIEYNPRINPNLVSFTMTDKKGREYPVILHQSKPQDMEKSEDIVVKGKAVDSVFYAHTILLKCPSKYEEQNSFQSETSLNDLY